MKSLPTCTLVAASALLLPATCLTTSSRPTATSIAKPTSVSPVKGTSTPAANLKAGASYSCYLDIATDSDYCQYSTSSSSDYTFGYTVTTTPCPTSTQARLAASGLNPSEAAWLSTRVPIANEAMANFLVTGFEGSPTPYDPDAIMQSPPSLGLAISGGGYRAMLNGVGVMKGLDSLGVLDSALYVSGLSGGAWAVGSWVLNNYASADGLLAAWDLPTSDNDAILLQWLFDNYGYCYPVQCESQLKYNSGNGAPISFADNWNRMMARTVLNGVSAGSTWSGIASMQAFTSGQYAFPIVVSNGQWDTSPPSFSPDATVYEMTPFEFGSWDPVNTGAFVPMNNIGSTFSAGAVTSGQCMQGLDNSAFILGSSSLAVTEALEDNKERNFTVPQATGNLVNPFCDFGPGVENDCSAYPTLYLDDGGSNNQVIPFLPLLQPARRLDTIIAVDSSADTYYNGPFGSSLNWTNYYALTERGQDQGIAFPIADTTSQAVSQNPSLVYTPTFFGCNPDDTSLGGVVPPLIIYLPNAPYTVYTNGSTNSTGMKEYATVASDLIENGVTLATLGDPAVAQLFSICLACAVAERSRWRQGIQMTSDCEACFDAYCAENKKARNDLIVDGQYQPPPIAGAQPGSGTYKYSD